jgi:hypothetical protein
MRGAAWDLSNLKSAFSFAIAPGRDKCTIHIKIHIQSTLPKNTPHIVTPGPFTSEVEKGRRRFAGRGQSGLMGFKNGHIQFIVAMTGSTSELYGRLFDMDQTDPNIIGMGLNTFLKQRQLMAIDRGSFF